MNNDAVWMKRALLLAEKAAKENEVPIGAVIVFRGKIIGEGYNAPMKYNDPTAHAEIMAIRSAALQLRNYRILDAILYVTLEPCLMCLGAILQARIRRVIFGAKSLKYGAFTIDKVDKQPGFSKLILEQGVMEQESIFLLQNFFKKRR